MVDLKQELITRGYKPVFVDYVINQEKIIGTDLDNLMPDVLENDIEMKYKSKYVEVLRNQAVAKYVCDNGRVNQIVTDLNNAKPADEEAYRNVVSQYTWKGIIESKINSYDFDIKNITENQLYSDARRRIISDQQDRQRQLLQANWNLFYPRALDDILRGKDSSQALPVGQQGPQQLTHTDGFKEIYTKEVKDKKVSDFSDLNSFQTYFTLLNTKIDNIFTQGSNNQVRDEIKKVKDAVNLNLNHYKNLFLDGFELEGEFDELLFEQFKHAFRAENLYWINISRESKYSEYNAKDKRDEFFTKFNQSNPIIIQPVRPVRPSTQDVEVDKLEDIVTKATIRSGVDVLSSVGRNLVVTNDFITKTIAYWSSQAQPVKLHTIFDGITGRNKKELPSLGAPVKVTNRPYFLIDLLRVSHIYTKLNDSLNDDVTGMLTDLSEYIINEPSMNQEIIDLATEVNTQLLTVSDLPFNEIDIFNSSRYLSSTKRNSKTKINSGIKLIFESYNVFTQNHQNELNPFNFNESFLTHTYTDNKGARVTHNLIEPTMSHLGASNTKFVSNVCEVLYALEEKEPRFNFSQHTPHEVVNDTTENGKTIVEIDLS